MTRKLAKLGATLVSLVAVVASQATTAAPADVVTANGTEAVTQARALEAEFARRHEQSAKRVDAAVRANVEREITRIKAPAITLALSEPVKRG